jgi:hypothetical protein
MEISRRELRTIILKEIRNISEADDSVPSDISSEEYDKNPNLYDEVRRVGFEALVKAGHADPEFDDQFMVVISTAPDGPIRPTPFRTETVGVIPDSKTVSVKVSGRQFSVGMRADQVGPDGKPRYQQRS